MDNTNHRLPTGLELDGITNKSFDGDWVSEKRDDRRKSLSHFFRLIHGLTFISYIMLSIYLYIYIYAEIYKTTLWNCLLQKNIILLIFVAAYTFLSQPFFVSPGLLRLDVFRRS